MGSSFVSNAFSDNSAALTRGAYQGNPQRSAIEVDRVLERIGPVSTQSLVTEPQEQQLGHHFSLAKGGLCSISSAPTKLGKDIKKEDLGGSGYAQDIFELVYPIAKRSKSNGEIVLEDVMRRHGLLAPGEQISDLVLASKRLSPKNRQSRSRVETIELSAKIVDAQSGNMQRRVSIRNTSGKFGLHFH
jgi:hypothetical protein